jgi:hypothetical protein
LRSGTLPHFGPENGVRCTGIYRDHMPSRIWLRSLRSRRTIRRGGNLLL